MTAIVRVVHSVEKNPALLRQIEPIIFPVLMHSLTPDGLDAIEDGIDIINCMIYHGTGPEAPISSEMWKLFPQILHITAGQESDVDGGFAFEYLSNVTTCVQNYIVKGSDTLMTVGPNQQQSYFHLTCNFIQRVLVINAAGYNKQDGISAMRLVMTILEKFPGMIDDSLPNLVAIMLAELKKAFDEPDTPPNYRSMLLQAFSMCFYNNCQITLQIMEQN